MYFYSVVCEATISGDTPSRIELHGAMESPVPFRKGDQVSWDGIDPPFVVKDVVWYSTTPGHAFMEFEPIALGEDSVESVELSFDKSHDR